MSIRNSKPVDFISIIIVNYNGRHFLGDCLAAVERQTLPRHCYEVLVIDNGSHDGSAEFIRIDFPGVRLIETGENLGFTGANNLGFRLARGRLIVLLNNDTRVAPGWLEALVKAASPADVGGVASHIVFRLKPDVVNSTGLLLLRDGRGADRDLNCHDRGDWTPEGVFGGCGASLLLKRKVIDEVGGFDRDLFMYYEDLDLAWRARLRGWRFVYEPKARVEHVCGGSSTPASPFLSRQIERNRTLVNLRNAPSFLAIWSCVGIILRSVRTIGRFVTRRRQYGLTPGHLRGMSSALLSVLVNLPSRLVQRYDTRIARRRRPDSEVLRFQR